MPAPLARGIIIAASVIVAASIAAYENPQFREWFDRSREKIAVAFQSTLDDIRPPRPRRDDPSMREDQDEKAEERRRQARQEILDRGKKLEELRRKRSASSDESTSGSGSEKRSPSFDTLVDDDGKLRSEVKANVAVSSAVETQDNVGTLRPRHLDQPVQNMAQSETQAENPAMHSSVDAPILLRQLNGPSAPATEPWESQYEREMRNEWNIPLPPYSNRTPTASTHPSESLVDLTPTTEDFPDPDYSVPSLSEAGHPLDRTEYFSIPPSRARSHSSHTLSDAEGSVSESGYYYAHPDAPHQPLEPRPIGNAPHRNDTVLGSSAASVAGSNNGGLPRHLSDFEQSEDDFSDIGDGARTPASAWTEVGSTASSVAGDRI